ncbi:MAG: LysE family translocator [Parvularculaceae bacterium]|nr:LysE family translocator [Parvularculaceae bacterium]
MTFETISSLIGFAFVSSITPGPNNIMLMTSGANFGLRRTVPHALGVSIGFCAMVLLVGAGLARVFEVWPLSLMVLKVICVAYLLYLAWKITQSSAPTDGEATSKPLSFLQAAAFQWVNPKAWAMALGAITLYASSENFFSIVIVAVVFMLINLPSVSIWALFGVRMTRLLSTPVRLKVFNWTMAILLVASVLPMLA